MNHAGLKFHYRRLVFELLIQQHLHIDDCLLTYVNIKKGCHCSDFLKIYLCCLGSEVEIFISNIFTYDVAFSLLSYMQNHVLALDHHCI